MQWPMEGSGREGRTCQSYLHDLPPLGIRSVPRSFSGDRYKEIQLHQEKGEGEGEGIRLKWNGKRQFHCAASHSLLIPASVDSFCSWCTQCPKGLVVGPFLVPFNPG